MNRMECVLGQLSERTNIAIDDATKADLTKRVWRKDAALWKEDEASQKIIKNSLGWLTVPDEMIGVINELTEFGRFNSKAWLSNSNGLRHGRIISMS